MKRFSFKNILFVISIFILSINIKYAQAQRVYANTQQTGSAGLLCLNCTVTNPAAAADGNLQTYSIVNVSVGIAAQTHEDLIFGTKPTAGMPVTVKLGSGDKLLSLTALGGITLQAYNGSVAVGQPLAAGTLLSALSNNNQIEVSFTPQATYDRVRVTLDGGLLGALSYIYLYEAFYTGNGPVACNAAIDELHGISAGLLNLGADIGGVVNPQNAIDGNINTASTLNAGVGLVGAYAQQTVIYSNTSVIGDSIRITLAAPPSLISAGVLQGITVGTYNGNNSNNDVTAISASLITLRLLDLSNNLQKFTITFVPTKVFDRVQLTLGGIASVLSTLNFYEAQRLIPSPIIKVGGVVTNNASICSGSSATFTASALPNTTFNWYAAAIGGSPIFTGATFTTNALTATTSYYVAAMRAGCTDESQRVKITATVNNIPPAPVVANNNVNVCANQTATFTATSLAGVTVNWYSAATGGTLLATGNNFTTGPLTQTTNYFAEAVAGGSCISPTRTQVTATIAPPPAAPGITAANVSICDGNVAVLSVASPVSGITYNWYATATGGTSLGSGSSFTSPALHANTNYYIEASNANGCTSITRTQASVTVVPNPADPTLSANSSTVAAGQTATIVVSNAQTGITYNWFTSAAAATPIFTGTSFTTPALFSATTYYVNAVNGTGCTSANRTAVTINVNINNNSPCTFANQQTSNINGLCIGCGVTNAALATDADTTMASTISTLAGLLGGYAEQQLQFQQAGFAGDTIKLVLQNPGGLLSASVLGQIQVTVYNGANQGTTYALNSGLLRVYLLAGSSNKYAVYIPATGPYDRITVRLNSGVLGALTGLNIYYAAQQFPKPLFNPISPEICNGSTAQINITSPANGTFNWFTAPTGGTSIHTGASFTTPVLTANTTYYVEYSRGACVSPVRYAVVILVNAAPAAPVITAQNVTVTSGQPATLNATATNGATVQWFTTATGGTPVATGNTYTTPALTANTTYYAGAATGSCVSVTRTPVTVTVNPIVIPNVTVTPPTVAVNPGQTASFTASSTTPGAVFNWFATPTGGTSIYTGATYTTPAEFANTTYYAEATIPSTGAVSATRASGTVTVNQLGVNPVACDAAIDQTNTTSGLLCVGCGISNATGAVDNDRNTFAQLNVPIGLVASYASQTLRFANIGLAGDSVVVELGIPATLASVSVLSQIAIATYNGATFNNDRFSVNPALISISLINGTSRFRIAFKATANFDRVEIRLNAALAGVFSSLNVYDAVQEVAQPVITTTSATACMGSQSTIAATASANATIKWYTSATGGTPIATGTTFTTPALTATTTYYAEASRTADGCTQMVRTPATVTVTPVPTAPVVANANTTVCSGQPATFNVQAVAGSTYNWFTTPTGGIPVHTGNSFTTANLNATTSYYVEAANGGSCSSSTRTQVTANVTATPANAIVNNATTQTCASSSATLTASSAQTGVTFNWYTAATGGTPVFTGAQFVTPALTTNTAYFVEVANGSCVSASRTEADVTVNPLPAAPTIVTTPSGGQVTSGQTAQISASSTTANVTFNWYNTATGGTPIFTGANFTTPALSSNTTYYVEAVSNASGCVSSQRTAVTISVSQIFSTSCDFAATQTTDLNNGLLCLLCNVATPDNAVDADTTNFSQLNLPIGVVGYVGQKLIFSDGGLAGDTVTLKLSIPVSLTTVGVLNGLQIASFNGATYNNDRINLSSSLLKVQILADGKTAIVKFVPGATFNAVEVRIVSGVGLFNTVNIYYSSKQVGTPQINAKIANICAGGTAVFAISNLKAGVTYKWYTSATGSTVAGSGSSFTTPALTATTTYYAESSRTSNGCANPNRVAVTANVTPLPVNPVLAQAAISICSGDQTTLAVNNAGSSTINWYSAATGGTLLFTGANFNVSPVATTSYYAEATNGTCASSARTVATVTVNPRPAAPGVMAANVLVCAGSTATLQVLNPVSGVNYQWFSATTGGTVAFTGSTFTTGSITQNTTYYVQATDGVTGCANNGTRTQVSINVTNSIAVPVLSATNTQVCFGGSASISITNPVNGMVYSFYTTATGGSPVFTGTTFNLSNLTANASYFVEASNSTGCISATRTETDITVLPIPTAPQVQASAGGSSISTCLGSSGSISIVNPQPTAVYRWYDAQVGGNLLYTGSQFNTPALSGNTTYYVEAQQAGNCATSGRTAVTITINAMPADPVLANALVNVCAGSPATLTISNAQAGVTYQWFDSPAQTSILFQGTTFVTGPLFNNTTYYVAAVNASGCQSSNLVVAQAAILPPPFAPLLVTSSFDICQNTTATFVIANPQVGYTYNWYADATGGSPIFIGTTFVTAAIASNTTFYAEAVNNTGCASTSRTNASITVGFTPTVPPITVQGAPFCPGSSAVLVADNNNSTVTINWYTSATGGTPVFTGNTFTSPNLDLSTTYYAEAVNFAGCISTNRTAVTVTILQQLAAPVIQVTATTATTVTFTWDPVPNATGYLVSLDNGITFPLVFGANSLSYTVSNLLPLVKVTITVKATGNLPCILSAIASSTSTTANPLGNQVWVPNAFTPNGDGKNDQLQVFGNTIKNLKVWIYDQWGTMIYTFSQPEGGWDGTYKGKAQPVGVYVYYLEATLTDGQLVKKKGTIDLLR